MSRMISREKRGIGDGGPWSVMLMGWLSCFKCNPMKASLRFLAFDALTDIMRKLLPEKNRSGYGFSMIKIQGDCVNIKYHEHTLDVIGFPL